MIASRRFAWLVALALLATSCVQEAYAFEFGTSTPIKIAGVALPQCNANTERDYIVVDPVSATTCAGGAGSLYANANYCFCDGEAQTWRVLVSTLTSGGGGAVTSVYGRTGAVAAQSGDYSANQVTNAAESSTLAGTGASQGASLIGVRDVAGMFTAADVEAALAELHTLIDTFGTADLTTTVASTTVTVNSDTGTDATIPGAVAGSAAGVMTGADKTKLDGIATGATVGHGDGGNCSAGNYPLGTDATGAVQSCTADDDIPESGDFAAADALEANGGLSAGSVPTAALQDDSVTAIKIAPNAVGSSEIGDNAVGNSELADNSIGSPEVIADSLDAGDLAPNSVTISEIADDAVGAGEIATGAVGAPEISTGGVGTDEIANGAVSTSDLNATECGTGQILEDQGGAWVCINTPAGGGGGSTNISVTPAASTLAVLSDTGTDGTIPAATTSLAGALTAVDKTKLDEVQDPSPIVDTQSVVSPFHVSPGFTKYWSAIDGAKNLSCTDIYNTPAGGASAQSADPPGDAADGWCDSGGSVRYGKTKADGRNEELVFLTQTEGYGVYRRVVSGADVDVVGQNIDVFATGGCKDIGDECAQNLRNFITDAFYAVNGTLNGVAIPAGSGAATVSVSNMSETDSSIAGEGKLLVFPSNASSGAIAQDVDLTSVAPGTIDHGAAPVAGWGSGTKTWGIEAGLIASQGFGPGWALSPADSAYLDPNNVASREWFEIVSCDSGANTCQTSWNAQGIEYGVPYGTLAEVGADEARIAPAVLIKRPVFDVGNDYVVDSLIVDRPTGFDGTGTGESFIIPDYATLTLTGLNAIVGREHGTAYNDVAVAAVRLLDGVRGRTQGRAGVSIGTAGSTSFLVDGTFHGWEYGVSSEPGAARTGFRYSFVDAAVDAQAFMVDFGNTRYDAFDTFNVIRLIESDNYEDSFAYRKGQGWGEGISTFNPFARTVTTARTTDNCAKWDSNGRLVDAGSPCGTSSLYLPLAGGTITGSILSNAGITLDLDEDNNSNSTTTKFTVRSGTNAESFSVNELGKAIALGSFSAPALAGTDGVDIGNDGVTTGILALLSAGGGYSTFQSAETGAAIYTLPADDGDAGEQLQTNGTGVLSWEAAGSGGGGSGDITDVGPGYATGAAFTDGVASTGTTLFVWEGTTVDGFELSILGPANPGADVNITLPTTTGTIVGTGDTGTVTAAMIVLAPALVGTNFTGSAAALTAGAATALAANPADCGSNTFAQSIVASGALTCSSVNLSTADTVGTLTVPKGGLGVSTLTSNAILKGAGTAAVVSSGVTIDASNNVDGIGTLDADGAITGTTITSDRSSSPVMALRDLETTDAEDNVRVTANCTVTTTGAEDCDAALDQYVDGVVKNVIVSVADGGLTIGSDQNTSVTVTTDGTGDGEVVLPANSIGSSEISTEVRTMYWDPSTVNAGQAGGAAAECSNPAAVVLAGTGGPKAYSVACPLAGSNLDGAIYGSTSMPDGWDPSVALAFQATWVSLDDPAATETVQGVINAQCASDDDPATGTWTANTGLDVTFVAGDVQYDQQKNSGTITPDGTCVAGDTLHWRYVVCDPGTPPTTGCAASTHDVTNQVFTGMRMEWLSNVGD